MFYGNVTYEENISFYVLNKDVSRQWEEEGRPYREACEESDKRMDKVTDDILKLLPDFKVLEEVYPSLNHMISHMYSTQRLVAGESYGAETSKEKFESQVRFDVIGYEYLRGEGGVINRMDKTPLGIELSALGDKTNGISPVLGVRLKVTDKNKLAVAHMASAVYNRICNYLKKDKTNEVFTLVQGAVLFDENKYMCGKDDLYYYTNFSVPLENAKAVRKVCHENSQHVVIEKTVTMSDNLNEEDLIDKSIVFTQNDGGKMKLETVSLGKDIKRVDIAVAVPFSSMERIAKGLQGLVKDGNELGVFLTKSEALGRLNQNIVHQHSDLVVTKAAVNIKDLSVEEKEVEKNLVRK